VIVHCGSGAASRSNYRSTVSTYDGQVDGAQSKRSDRTTSAPSDRSGVPAALPAALSPLALQFVPLPRLRGEKFPQLTVIDGIIPVG
jgi:hypothetical protein